jgi:hypothetical protein
MTKCKHWDCGWCYAPDDVKTNALGNGGCIHSECCPYLKSQNQMTNETDISKVLIEGDTATINGVKYKRVEPPKSRTLFIEILNKTGGRYDPRITKEFIDIMKEWLPDELEYDGEEYQLGWNDVLQSIKGKLR